MIGCINALSATWAEVERGVYGGALHIAFMIYLNLSVQTLKLEARPGSCFVACGSA